MKKLFENKCVKIFCRSFDLHLYEFSKTLYASMGIECVRLTDQTADGYFYTMLKDKDCDIAINIDEDAFVVNPDAVLDLVEFVIENGYANAGCPDGGGGCPRGANPIVTNPFFNVFNLSLIRSKFSLKAVKSFDYKAVVQEMEDAYPKDILLPNYNFNRTDYEPFYPFFFWLAYNFKTYYLLSEKHNDKISTILYNQNKVPIILHSWFARFYNMSSFVVKYFQKGAGKQKQRIDNLIDEAYFARQMEKPVFTCRDNFRFNVDKLIRWSIKVPQRIAGWPRKWRKKLLRQRESLN